MKKLILSIVLATAALADASTVTLSSATTAPSVWTFNSGALVPNGSLVRVGFLETAGNVSTFKEFGTSVVGNAGAFSNIKPSKLNGNVTNTNGEGDDALFNGKDVYVWIYNATTEAAATQRGLFKANVVGTSTNVVFPVDDPNVASDALTYQGLQFIQYITDPGLQNQGSFDAAGAANADGTGTGRFILGNLVPEPSSFGLLALAGLALARRRR